MPQDTKQADQFVKKLNLPAMTGTVKFAEGKYYFVEGEKKILLPSSFISEDKLKNMVGHKITAVMTDKTGKGILVLVPNEEPVSSWKQRCFMCYVPAPEIWKRIDIEMQHALINQFQKAGVIDLKQAETLKEAAI